MKNVHVVDMNVYTPAACSAAREPSRLASALSVADGGQEVLCRPRERVQIRTTRHMCHACATCAKDRVSGERCMAVLTCLVVVVVIVVVQSVLRVCDPA